MTIVAKSLMLESPQGAANLGPSLHVDWVRLGTCVLVLFPYFYGFIRLAGDEAGTGAVEACGHDAVFAVQRPRLRARGIVLEAMTRAVVPESHGPIVAAREEDAVLVDARGVEDGVVPDEILDEGAVTNYAVVRLVVTHSRRERRTQSLACSACDSS